MSGMNPIRINSKTVIDYAGYSANEHIPVRTIQKVILAAKPVRPVVKKG